MLDPTMQAAVRDFATEKRYGSATVERWMRLQSADAAALLELAQELKLGENQLRDFWEWGEEIAGRAGSSIAQVLAGEAVSAARRPDVGRNDRVKRLKSVLRRLRFPQLAAAEDRLVALTAELQLPASVRLTVPEFLEGDHVRVEIVADSAGALRAATRRLLQATDSPACAKIFALLEEAP